MGFLTKLKKRLMKKQFKNTAVIISKSQFGCDLRFDKYRRFEKDGIEMGELYSRDVVFKVPIYETELLPGYVILFEKESGQFVPCKFNEEKLTISPIDTDDRLFYLDQIKKAYDYRISKNLFSNPLVLWTIALVGSVLIAYVFLNQSIQPFHEQTQAIKELAGQISNLANALNSTASSTPMRPLG